MDTMAVYGPSVTFYFEIDATFSASKRLLFHKNKSYKWNSHISRDFYLFV